MLAVLKDLQARLKVIEQKLDSVEAAADSLKGSFVPPELQLAERAFPPTPDPIRLGDPNDGTEEPYRQLDLGLSTDGMGGVVVIPVDEPLELVVAATTHG